MEGSIKSICLEHCWVCSVRFRDVVPPGPAHREEHHIIPRAYGGADGPTVSLCDAHHTLLHKVAVALINDKSTFTLLRTEPRENHMKVMWLASRVVNAHLATKNDPNKAASVMLTLNLKHRTMVDRLKKVYPKARGRAAVLEIALENLYRRHFID